MTSASASSVDVLVVGGGIAGLVATYDLHRAGLHVLLCEARERLGGLIYTEEVSGCLVEAGPDSMLVQKPAALTLCHELGLGDELISTLEPRTAFVLHDGALHPIPTDSILGLPVTQQAIDQCGMLSPDGRASLARDLTSPLVSPAPEGDESIGAFLRRRFSDEVVRILAQPLLGGIHAGDVERLSMRALFPALADADRPGISLLLTLAARRRGSTPDGVFRSLRGGMSALVSRLISSLPATTLSIATEVKNIRVGSPFEIETVSGRIAAHAVVLAVPAWQAARLVGGLDDDLAQSLSTITYASTATITLAYRQDAVAGPLRGTGFVVPRGEATRMLAASWTTSKWPGRAPRGIVSMRAFVGGVFDADLLELEDDALAAMAHRDLARLLEIREGPLLTRIYRWQRAGPQYEVGHAVRVTAIEHAAGRRPGLWLTGSALRGVGIPDCVADARAIARRVAASFASGTRPH